MKRQSMHTSLSYCILLLMIRNTFKRFLKTVKPDFFKIVLTLLVLVYPFIQERAINEQGAVIYADEYSVMNLLVAYIRLKDFTPLLVVLVLSLLIYVFVAIFINFAKKIYKRRLKKTVEQN
jgi:hypothetical protein